ncbi:acyltransferase domain-containing protein, partial [Streptomyces sp. NPDC102441]|uniref:acyltransferase domain-containing protein n=1 Tax=Streptomyces sp. NPDC102441 TaxID=3366176 RepID=UPI00382F8F72
MFVFPGQGSQWPGMALELLDTSPVFAERLREVATAVEQHVDWTVEDVLRGTATESIEQIEVVQPVLFTVHLALATLWEHHGIHPDAVIGHSQGEIAAACVADALTLHDAAQLIVLRSQLFADELTGHGGVASIALSPTEVEKHLTQLNSSLTIAGINGPHLVTVAGEPDQLEELVAHTTAQGTRARIIAATVASHSPQVEPLRQKLTQLLKFITPRQARIPIYSTVTGHILNGTELNADYWYENCRRPVLFEPAIRQLLKNGHHTFIETSAHPVLTLAIDQTAEDADTHALTLGSLRRKEGGQERFLTSLAHAWTHGTPVNWQQTNTTHNTQTVDLPTYPFQHTHYW